MNFSDWGETAVAGWHKFFYDPDGKYRSPSGNNLTICDTEDLKLGKTGASEGRFDARLKRQSRAASDYANSASDHTYGQLPKPTATSSEPSFKAEYDVAGCLFHNTNKCGADKLTPNFVLRVGILSRSRLLF